MKKHPPTKRKNRSSADSGASRDREGGRKESRVKLNPEIFVMRVHRGRYDKLYARAHLRNKKGDVFLCWKDGNRVRNFYLGRRKQKPPTQAASSS